MPLCWETSNQQLGWWLIIVWTADVTHRQFHHPTFLRRKVSLKHHRLRSFRETIIPLCKSAGNRRNWWHHGCQSWTLWFVSRKAICFVHVFLRIKGMKHDMRGCRVYFVYVALKCSFSEMHLQQASSIWQLEGLHPKTTTAATADLKHSDILWLRLYWQDVCHLGAHWYCHILCQNMSP